MMVKLVPAGADVIFLSGGEFDGDELQAKLAGFDWKYVCRTASNAILFNGEEFSFQELLLQPGKCLEIPEVPFTRQCYGSVLVVAWWRETHDEPLYQISNMDLREELICLRYSYHLQN